MARGAGINDKQTYKTIKYIIKNGGLGHDPEYEARVILHMLYAIVSFETMDAFMRLLDLDPGSADIRSHEVDNEEELELYETPAGYPEA